MTPDLDKRMTKQHILPFDEERDLRLQAYHYQANIYRTLQSLKKLVRESHLDADEEYHLLYGLAYIETHVENQTQDMCANILTRCN